MLDPQVTMVETILGRGLSLDDLGIFGAPYLGHQYSQNSVATLGVLTVRVRARCSVEVVSGASGMVSVNFRIKWLL